MSILRVPHYEQQTEYTCGPACLEMVLAFFHKRKSEEVLAKEANTSPYTGTSHSHMIEAARNEGFDCEEYHDSSIGQIKQVLESGLPVIVNYIEPSEEVGHYAVVVGMENRNIILNDPANGRTQKFNECEFVRRWHSTNSKRWMMVMRRNTVDYR